MSINKTVNINNKHNFPNLIEIYSKSEQLNKYYQTYFSNTIDTSMLISKNDSKIFYFIFYFLFDNKKVNEIFFISNMNKNKKIIRAYEKDIKINMEKIKNIISKFLSYCLMNSNSLSQYINISNIILTHRILNLIKFYFIDDIITENDFKIILSLQIISCLYETSQEPQNDIIKNIKPIENIVKFLLSFKENKNKMHKIKLHQFDNTVIFIIEILNKIILKNKNNIYFLSNNRILFDLIELSQISIELSKTIVPLLITVYKHHFNIDFVFDYLSEQFIFRKSSENVIDKTNSLITKNIFLDELFKLEKSIVRNNDDIFIPNGFYFNDFEKNGIICKPIKKFPNNSNGYSIVISFQLDSNSKVKKYTLFTFYENSNSKNKNIVHLFIQENKLKVKISNNKNPKNLFDITNNKNYVLWIFSIKEKKKSHLIFYLNNFEHSSIKDIKFPDCSYFIEIGYNSQNLNESDNFNGLIGTFILFNQCLIKGEQDNQNITKLVGLKGFYENLIYIGTKRDFLRLEQNVDLSLKKINLNVYEDIEIMISTKSLKFFNNNNNIKNNLTNEYNCNYFRNYYLGDNNKFQFGLVDNNTTQKYLNYPVEYNNTFLDFLDNNGIMYLQIELYYFISIISNKEEENINIEDIFKNINMNFVNICSLFFNCYNSMTPSQENLYEKEINNFFYTLNDLISINAKYGYKMNSIFISIFGNYFEFLLKKNIFFSKCEFLLIFEYYDLNDNKVFELLFNFISMSLNQFKDNSLQFLLFEKIIDLDTIYLTHNIKKSTTKEYSILIRKLIREIFISDKLEFFEIYRKKIKNIKTKIINYFQNQDTNIDIINNFLKLMYKYLKNLYFVIDSKEVKDNFITFGKEISNILFEFFNNLFQFLAEKFDIKKNKNIETLPPEIKEQFILVELIKSLSIRFLDYLLADEYIKKSEDESKSSNYTKIRRSTGGSNIQKNINSNTKYSFNCGSVKGLNPSRLTLLGINDQNNFFKEIESNSDKNIINMSNNSSECISKSDNYLYKKITFFDNITLSPYTFKSFYVCLFRDDISNYKKFQFIKNDKKLGEVLLMYEKKFSKNKYLFQIIIRLFEKQVKSDYCDNIFMTKFESFEYYYNIFHNFLINMFKCYSKQPQKETIKNPENKAKEIKKMINSLFVENGNYTQKFYQIILDFIIVNNKILNNVDAKNPTKLFFDNFYTKIQNDINEFVDITISELIEPFYFQFLNELYLRNDNDNNDFVLKTLEALMEKLIKYKSNNKNSENDKIAEMNNKCLLILIYKIIFYVQKRDIIISNNFFITKLISYLRKLLSESYIIYLKLLFPIEDGVSDNNSKKKLLIEILYEILIELQFEYIRHPDISPLQDIEHFFNNDFDVNEISSELLIKKRNKETYKDNKIRTKFCLMDKIILVTNNSSDLKKEILIRINDNFSFSVNNIEDLKKYLIKKINFKEDEIIFSVCIVFFIKILMSINELNETVIELSSQEKNKKNDSSLLPNNNEGTKNETTPIDNCPNKDINLEKICKSFKKNLLNLLSKLCKDCVYIQKNYSSLNPFIPKNKKINSNKLYEYFCSYIATQLVDIENYSKIIPDLISQLNKYKSSLKIFSRVIYIDDGRTKQYTKKTYNQILKSVNQSKDKSIDEIESFILNNDLINSDQSSRATFGVSSNLIQNFSSGIDNNNIINNDKEFVKGASLSGKNLFTNNFNNFIGDISDSASKSETQLLKNFSFSRTIGDNTRKKINNDINKYYLPSFKFKKDIMRLYFSYYFNSLLTYDSDFHNIKKLYKYTYKTELENNNKLFGDNIYVYNYDNLIYPMKFKNYVCNNYDKIFLKKDFDFFEYKHFNYTHQYLFKQSNNYNYVVEKKILLPDKKLIEENDYAHKYVLLNEDNIYINTYECELITIKGTIFGNFYEFENGLIFKSDLENDKRKTNSNKYIFCSIEYDHLQELKKIIIEYNDIKEVINHTYFFHWIALEIFMKNGSSYLFNFFNEETNNAIFEIFKLKKLKKIKIIKNIQEYLNKEKLPFQWKDNKISTYDYLLLLNKLSSRTYNDSNQYLVMPWLFLTDNIKTIRNFDLPISMQNEDRQIEYLKEREESIRQQVDILTLSNHYSTSAYIYFYLMRVNPFTNGMIKFQSNHFDSPDRQFADMKSTLSLCQNHKNNRELIPELFSIPEIYLNINYNDFGQQKDGKLINDVNFKPYAKNPIEFCYLLKNLINNDVNINNNINKWFDFIFGVNQLSKNNDKEKTLRTFNDYSYGQLNKKHYTEITKKKNQNNKRLIEDIKNCMNITVSFGQCPYQILNNLHPQKNILIISENTTPGESVINCDSNEIQEISKKNDEKLGIVYFRKNYNGNNLYCLLKNQNLEIYKKIQGSDNYILYTVIIQKNQLNFYKTNKINNNLIFRPKFMFCELKEDSFIFCRSLDKTLRYFKINNANPDKLISEQSFALNKYITTIIRINDTEFITGNDNGKISKWELTEDKITSNLKLELLLSIKSNKSDITCLVYNEKLGIIISSDSNTIVIRKIYDFEFLSSIKIHNDKNEKQTIVDIKISNNDFIYVLININDSDVYEIHGYTVNGLFFGKYTSKISNFCLTNSGKIIIGEIDNCAIKILDPVYFKEIYCKTIDDNKNNNFYHFHFEKPDTIYFGLKNNEESKIKIIKLNENEINNHIFD